MRYLLFLLASLAFAQTQVYDNVGGPSYVDSSGTTWGADTGCSGGAIFTGSSSISGTTDDDLYKDGRGGNAFSCSYTVVGRVFYFVTLRMSEYQGSINDRNPRIFNIFVNGVNYRGPVNIFGATGARNTAYDLTIGPIAVFDNTINIVLSTISNPAIVQAISIIQDSSFTGANCTSSPVVCSFTDITPTTGKMTVVVKAGAGQSTNDLQQWKDNSNNILALVDHLGQIYSSIQLIAGMKASLSATGLHSAGDTCNTYSSDGTFYGAIDLALCRNAAGILEVNNGTSNNWRDIKFRYLYPQNGTEPTCNSGNRGVVVLVQGGAGVADTFRICTKDGADAYAYRALF